MTCEECPSHRSLKVKIRTVGAMMIIPTRSRPAAMDRTVPRRTGRAGRDQAWAVAAVLDTAVAMTIEAEAGRHHLALVGAVGLRWKGIMIVEMMAMMKENGEVKVELGIQVGMTADDRQVRIGERMNVRITKQDREINNKKDGMEKQEEEEEGEEMTRDQEMIKDLFQWTISIWAE